MVEDGARRVSVSTVAFDGYPLPVALSAIAGCGARHAELAYIQGYGDFDETAFSAAAAGVARGELAQAGLSSVAVSAHIDLGAGGALERLRRRLDFAGAIGARILITNAGTTAARDAVMRTVEAALPLCLDAGLVLALENPGHGTGALFGCAAEGVALVQAFASPGLGLNYDAGNILTYSGGACRPETDLAAALPWVAHVHLKDFKPHGADWVFTPLGDGQLDLASLAPSLRQADLPIGIELPLRLRRPGRGDPVRASAPEPLAMIEQAVKSSLARLQHALVCMA